MVIASSRHAGIASLFPLSSNGPASSAITPAPSWARVSAPSSTSPAAAAPSKPRRDVHGVADHRVVAQLGADVADERRTGVDADPEGRELGIAARELVHRVAHRQRGAGRPHRVVDLAGRRVEHRHHFVARVVDDGALVLDEARDRGRVVAVEQRDDVLGVVAFGVGGEPAQVGEERGDLDDRATERGLIGIGEQSSDDRRREVAAEQRVDRAVEAGVLELDGELRGDGRRHRPVAVVEAAVLALEGDDARRFVLDQERPDHGVVALDRGVC